MITPLPCAGLIYIENKKLLLAFSKNKQCFYLPGGKINEGETPATALCREIAEELNINLQEDELRFFTHISAPAYGEKNGVIMEQDCFLSEKTAAPEASAEIGELRYFTLKEYMAEKNKAPGAILVLELLKQNELID